MNAEQAADDILTATEQHTTLTVDAVMGNILFLESEEGDLFEVTVKRVRQKELT